MSTSTEEYKIKCKKCGYELPPDASFCDNCGEPVEKIKQQEKEATKNKAKKKRQKAISKYAWLIWAILMFIVFAIAISSKGGGEEPEISEESKTEIFADMKTRVTAEQYEQIEFGMTYDEVVNLLGEDGLNTSTNYFIWPGEYYDGEEEYYFAPHITLAFSDNGNLINIEEINVIDGEEIYEGRSPEDMPAVYVNEKMLSEMKNRMSYEEIAEIIGDPGVLIESESDKNGSSTKKVYKWKYIKEGEDVSYDRYLDIAFYNDKADESDWVIWGQY